MNESLPKFKKGDTVICIKGISLGAGWIIHKVFIIERITKGSDYYVYWDKEKTKGVYEPALQLWNRLQAIKKLKIIV